MNTCIQCKKEFHTYEAEFECQECDSNGYVERWYDWCFNELDYITCQDCGGGKTIKCDETQFCSDECREDYFTPITIFK